MARCCRCATAPATKQVEQWTALGGRTFAREARARDEGKEPVVLTFPNALPKEATAPLRAAGFRFNKVLQHWEGMTRFDEAEHLAATHGGTARRVTPLPAPEGPTPKPRDACASGAGRRASFSPAACPPRPPSRGAGD